MNKPLFSEWSKTILLENWMSNSIKCCESAGIAPPTSALQLHSVVHLKNGSLPLSKVITPPLSQDESQAVTQQSLEVNQIFCREIIIEKLLSKLT